MAKVNSVPTKKPISVKHLANFGDVVAAMCGLKAVSENLGRKIDFYQWLDVQAQYYQGAVHPVLSDDGKMVCMNRTVFEMAKPLVESQEYINSFVEWRGEKVAVDLDIIRNKLFVNMPNGAIQTWLMLAYPDMAADISKPWIKVKSSPKYKNKIILNFTERYRNTMISYFFLKEYQADCVFTGTEVEHQKFCNMWGITIPRIEINDFLELAQYIKGCRFFMGNQSSAWNLAIAMGKPSILEMCQFAPNCQPFVGTDNLGFYHQDALTHYFEYLSAKY